MTMNACKRCGADGIVLPSDVATVEVTCAACGARQPVRDYAADPERLRGMAAQIMAAKAERDARRRDGVTCPGCGGNTPLPDDPSARDFTCRYCAKALLVADFVDARVLAGAELRAGMDAIYAKEAKRRRTAAVVTAVALGVVGVAVLLAVLWSR